MEEKKWAICLHGGAGVMSENEVEHEPYKAALLQIIEFGRDLLQEGRSSLDVVELVTKQLEDCPLFNAGKGSVLNNDGEVRPEASIMTANLRCGAVSYTQTVKNPISLARLVMENTTNILYIGDGAEAFADLHKQIERVDPSYFITETRKQRYLAAKNKENIATEQSANLQKDNEAKGTVGCVALDIHGVLSAATSTGGLNNKKFARVGDSPIIGAGTWADKNCAISTTGTGEEFLRRCAAHAIGMMMQYGKMTLEQAVQDMVHNQLNPDDGGIIGVDSDGNCVMKMNSSGMYRASASSTTATFVGVN